MGNFLVSEIKKIIASFRLVTTKEIKKILPSKLKCKKGCKN